MNTKCLLTPKNFSKTFLVLIPCIIFPGAFISNAIWVKLLNYNFPVPFITLVQSLLVVPLQSLAIWYRFPKQYRNSKLFQGRYKCFVATYWGITFMNIEYAVLGKVFIAIPERYQWMLAATFPILREMHTWIFLQLAYKSAGAHDTSVTISMAHNINTRHVVFLSVMLGSAATDHSSWVILGTDFVYNIYLAIKIIWIRKRRCASEKSDREMFELLYTLTTNELVEVVVPVTYMIGFFCAYYGPNGEQIGNVRSSYFHYTPVTDIKGCTEKLVLFFMFDLMNAVMAAILLWSFCKISLLRAYMLMQKEFWAIITITTAMAVYLVRVITIYYPYILYL